MVENGLRPAAKAYIAALVCLAIGLVPPTLAWASRPSAREALLAAALAGCMALAWLFPLHFAFKTKLYVDTAVTVAAILLFEPAVAMLVAGGGTLLAHGLRRASRDWTQALFNAAQSMLLAAVGALLLGATGWDPTHPSFGQPGALLVLPVAGGIMHLLSVLAVATVVALQARLPLVESWRQALLEDPRVEILAQVSLLGIGVVAAIVADVHPWGLALLVAPIAAVHGTLRHQNRLRQEAERARLASEASLADAQRIARLGSWGWDLASGRQTWSDETYRVFGLDPRRIAPTYETFLQAVHPLDRDGVHQAIREAIERAAPLRIDYRLRRPDGTARLVHHRAEILADADGRGNRFAGTVQDVTELRALEARLADITERQRITLELAETRRHLAESREDERLRLARGLHDGPVQDLLAISYQLADLRPAIGPNHVGIRATSVADPIRREVLNVVGQLRGMIGELRPAGLAEFGLPAALEGYVTELQRRADTPLPTIDLDLDLDGVSDALSQPLSLSLFRIAEALRNALRHAEARRVVVSLRQHDDEVVLRVSDDGRGFQVPPHLNAFAEASHFGLVGIAERVDQAAGALTVESTPATGTTIVVRLSLTASRGADA